MSNFNQSSSTLPTIATSDEEPTYPVTAGKFEDITLTQTDIDLVASSTRLVRADVHAAASPPENTRARVNRLRLHRPSSQGESSGSRRTAAASPPADTRPRPNQSEVHRPSTQGQSSGSRRASVPHSAEHSARRAAVGPIPSSPPRARRSSGTQTSENDIASNLVVGRGTLPARQNGDDPTTTSTTTTKEWISSYKHSGTSAPLCLCLSEN